MARSSRTTPASPWRITAPLVVSSFAYATAQNTIVPVIPQVQEATGSSASQVAWMITGFFVSSAGLTVLTGRLGDLFGRKRVLCAILAIFGGGAAIAALGNSLAPIIAGRVVMGVGGGVFPLAYAILSAHLPRDRAAFGMGLISSMFGVGGALGLPLGGLVAGHFGHKGLFWATAAVALLALATVAGAIPSDRGERTGTVDWLGAILLTLALGGPLTAVSRAEEWVWAAPWTLGLLALGAVAFAVFLVVERKVSHPLVDLDVMRRRNVWAANLVTLLATTGHGVMFFLVPQIVQLPKSSGVGLGVDVDHSGLFLLPGAVLLIFAGPLTGRLVPIIADEHADPELGSGAVKITPGHDFNDFEVGKRAGFKPAEMLNMLSADAKVVQTADGLVPEELVGLDRFEAWLPRFDPLAAVARAQAFSPERFRRAFTAVLDEAIADRF